MVGLVFREAEEGMSAMPHSPIRLAVPVSGSGTTLANLIDQIAKTKLNARIELVIGSRPGLLSLTRATHARIPTAIVDRREFSDVASFSRQVFELMDNAKVDLVCLAGWLCLLEIPKAYEGRVMNIHPALLPDFGGKGMYGLNVHKAVIDSGQKLSGCTVHFVDQAYDTGPIILQRVCPVLENDTPQSVAARVFEEEKVAYPMAIELFARGRLKIEGNRVHIMPDRISA
jgi:formyltetrahydrofolate-dependent phosphoribosylglycinamide formyltransferase